MPPLVARLLPRLLPWRLAAGWLLPGLLPRWLAAGWLLPGLLPSLLPWRGGRSDRSGHRLRGQLARLLGRPGPTGWDGCHGTIA